MRPITITILLVAMAAAAQAETRPAVAPAPTSQAAAKAAVQGAPAAKPAAMGADIALERAAMALMFARVISVTGVEKAPTAAIKTISLAVAERSVALLKDLETAAKAAGLEARLPRTLDADHAGKAELLLSSFETQFEHEYLDMQIAAHRDVVAVLADGGAKRAPAALSPILDRIAAQLATNLKSLEEAKRQLPAM